MCSASEKRARLPTDEELMLAVRAGDLAAFEQIVIRFQGSAWTVAYRFLGDASEAEDVAQQAFLKIFGAAPRYQPEATFRTYLYRVVTRLCLDHANKKRPTYRQDLPEVSDAGLSPLDGIARQELRQDVQRALDALPSKQRLTVIWKYYEGLSYAEMAAALNTTVKAVERLLARARETLGKRLQSPNDRA
jgi:RNA polymerase sigma-70 factor (ECF subfamily)